MLSTKQVGLKNVAALTNLQKAVKIANIPTSLNDIVINFEIHDGKIITKPFEMKMGEVKMKLGGTTSFEKVIDYDGVFYLPATMRFQQFSEVKFKIVGPFDKPQVKLDLGGSLKNVLNDAKEKVITQVTKQVEAVKTQVLDEAKLRKEQAIKAAQQQADNIRNTAKQTSDQVLATAKSQADQLVGKASNPFAKKVAEVSAQKIIAEAQKKSNEILQKGDSEAKAALQKANDIK
jgi:aspartyl-tRNA synthetase